MTAQARVKWLVLAVLILGLAMDLLDMTVVNVAMPRFMARFSAGVDQVQWIATAYMATVGVCVPIPTYLSARFGYRRAFLGSLGLFAAGSILSGLAWSLPSMVVFRVVQAVGGGMILPLTLSILYETFPESERGLAMGILGLPMMVAPAVGPVIGGYLVQYQDWRWIFYLNVPVALVALALGAAVLPRGTGRGAARLDWVGLLACGSGLGALLVALNEGPVWGWSAEGTLCLFIASGTALAVFVSSELASEHPLLDLRVFRNAPFAVTLGVTGLAVMTIFSSLFFIPLYMQNVRGWGAFHTGVLLMPQALAAAVVMPIAGLLIDRVGVGAMSLLGFLFLGLGTYRLTDLAPATPGPSILWTLVLIGVGTGLSTMPAMTAGLNALPDDLTEHGSACVNLVRQVGSAFGVAVLSTVVQVGQNVHYAGLASGITAFRVPTVLALRRFQASPQAPPLPHALAQAVLAQLVATQAATLAFRDAFWLGLALAAAGLLPATLLLRLLPAAGGPRGRALP